MAQWRWEIQDNGSRTSQRAQEAEDNAEAPGLGRGEGAAKIDQEMAFVRRIPENDLGGFRCETLGARPVRA